MPSAETPSTSTSPPPAPSTSADPAPVVPILAHPGPRAPRAPRRAPDRDPRLPRSPRVASRRRPRRRRRERRAEPRARARAIPLPAGPRSQSEEDPDCATARRLNDLIVARGASPSKFVRVPAQYYDEDLPFRAAWRRRPLRAPHVQDHLHGEHEVHSGRLRGPGEQRWYLVLVQYTARLSQQKLRSFCISATTRGGGKGQKGVSHAPAKEEDSERLTGYEHGAVTPLRTAEPVPVLVSREMETLAPGGEFWLGGGEVDLKMRVSYDELSQIRRGRGGLHVRRVRGRSERESAMDRALLARSATI